MTDASDAQLFARNVPGLTQRLQRAVVGIAGLGGLGSNVAVALTRAGVGTLILADDDHVALPDLNRQYYFQTDVGRHKVEALSAHLRAINPDLRIVSHLVRLTPETITGSFAAAELLIEAFDQAESKQWLIETWCRSYPRRPIVCASGLAGYGKTDQLRVRSAGRLYLCGDEESDQHLGLCSARVAIVANMQANVAIELLMEAT
ncbi:MAG: sulfur carrier protein ThiS adenylyltransferase ThiF [Candidatus Eisenbacteria sp.]|nr:sulfur carrier protein ThiS adenylyltransferase ThiF [Candidatus Eisenbacteria bacterium]